MLAMSAFIKNKKRYLLLLFAILLFLALVIVLDRVWQVKVINSVKNTIAVESGETIETIISRRYENKPKVKTRWSIVHLDDELWMGAQVFCLVEWGRINSDKGSVLLAWQWDMKWPFPLALTSETATIFPLLDPGCPLSDTTQRRLYSGGLGITKYFSKERIERSAPR